MGDFFPFVLLIGALLLFLVSTRQWALWIRGLVWGGGLLLLIGAIALVLSNDNHGLLSDILSSDGRRALGVALDKNGARIAGSVTGLLDLFLIFGGLIGVLALVAFTPGEEVENVTRPIAIGLVGAIIGGLVALTIVGTGRGQGELNYYSTNAFNANDVVDGDSIIIDGVQIRLRGIDAPELGQTCRFRTGAPARCGEEAQRFLVSLVRGNQVSCTVPEGRDVERYLEAQVYANCDLTTRTGEVLNLSAEMIEAGHAIEYMGQAGPYQNLVVVAQRERRGLHANGSCTLRPDVWLHNSALRGTFENGAGLNALPRNAPTIPASGVCPRGGGGGGGNNQSGGLQDEN
ncbi:MAG: thermonuclease family protein [Hyphomonadaceae bacterium]